MGSYGTLVLTIYTAFEAEGQLNPRFKSRRLERRERAGPPCRAGWAPRRIAPAWATAGVEEPEIDIPKHFYLPTIVFHVTGKKK